jgi:hypothetical protein
MGAPADWVSAGDPFTYKNKADCYALADVTDLANRAPEF